jgi:pimeloyl-ACP methyl ester carboxylesterase
MDQHATAGADATDGAEPAAGDDPPARTAAGDDPALSTDAVALPDGREIAYSVCGPADGSPVVLHHGTPGSRLFAALLADAAVDAGIRLVTPDRPGYGRSSSPPDGWGPDDWREDLHAVLRAESIDRAGACGFSGGGPFAIAAAEGDRIARLGLVSTVVPPSDEGLAGLARIPYAIRLLFPLFGRVASISGPDAVVSQYTDRSVPPAVARATAADFHEALSGGLLGGGASAVERESRSFTTDAVDPDRLALPVRAWHGTRDDNAPIAPVEAFADACGGTLRAVDADHLGTLLDRGSEALRWVAPE